MSFFKRPFVPAFLNRLDDYLLKHKPEIWSARTHLVAYFCLAFMAVLAVLSFLVPDDPRSESEISIWVVFVSLIAVIALVFWIIFLLRFNVFKRYGFTNPLNRLYTFLLYFLSIGFIVFICYIPPIVVSFRANLAFTDTELASDINEMNSLICELAYDSLPHKWMSDTVIVVNSTQGRYDGINVVGEVEENSVPVDTAIASSEVTHTIPTISFYTPEHRLIDTAEYRIKKLSTDSLVALNDSVFIFSECPGYEFVTDPGLAEHSSIPLLQSRELFEKYIRHPQHTDKDKLITAYNRLKAKYYYLHHSIYNNYNYEYAIDETYRNSIQFKYKTSEISDSINNIYDRMHLFSSNDLEWQIRVWFYISLVLSILMFNFRHSTVKTFFLSLLVAVLLTVFTSLVLAFTSGDEDSFFGSYIFYTCTFAIIALVSMKNKTRNVISGISINIFSWLLYFFPLLLTSMYYEHDRDRFNETNLPYESYNYEAMQQALFYSEILGLIIFLIAIPTLFHILYRRWYSLPEE
jgi:hypothetical protein